MERLKTFTDKRGSLTLLEVGQDIPLKWHVYSGYIMYLKDKNGDNMLIRNYPSILWL